MSINIMFFITNLSYFPTATGWSLPISSICACINVCKSIILSLFYYIIGIHMLLFCEMFAIFFFKTFLSLLCKQVFLLRMMR